MRETTTSDDKGTTVTRKSVTSSNGDSQSTYVSQSSNGTVKASSSDTSSQSFADTSGTEGWWSRLWTW